MIVVRIERCASCTHLVHFQHLLLHAICFSLCTLGRFKRGEDALRLFDFNLTLEFSAESAEWLELFVLLIDDLYKCLSVSNQTYVRSEYVRARHVTYFLRTSTVACPGCRLPCASVSPGRSFCYQLLVNGCSNGDMASGWMARGRFRCSGLRGLEESRHDCRSAEEVVEVRTGFVCLPGECIWDGRMIGFL